MNINLSKSTINLTKKQVINLSKESSGLDKVMVGIGWDEKNKSVIKPGGILKSLKTIISTPSDSNDYDYDLDAWAALLPIDSKKFNECKDICYFSNTDIFIKDKFVIQHHGDNLTGSGDGDDEQIDITLSGIPESYDRILIGVTIYSAIQRKQSFKDIQNLFIRIVDSKDNTEICRYVGTDINTEYSDCYTFIAGVLIREGNDWHFKAEGFGNKHDVIRNAVNRYLD